jgi:hypothetical protein
VEEQECVEGVRTRELGGERTRGGRKREVAACHMGTLIKPIIGVAKYGHTTDKWVTQVGLDDIVSGAAISSRRYE